jgi:hypothetical protein
MTAFEQRLLTLPVSQALLGDTGAKLPRMNRELQVTSDLYTFVRVQLLANRQGHLQLRASPGTTMHVYIDGEDPLPMPRSTPMAYMKIGTEGQPTILPYIGEELSDGTEAGEFLYLGLILEGENNRRLLQTVSGFVDMELLYTYCEPACDRGECMVTDTSGAPDRGVCKCPTGFVGDACEDQVSGITPPTPRPNPWYILSSYFPSDLPHECSSYSLRFEANHWWWWLLVIGIPLLLIIAMVVTHMR